MLSYLTPGHKHLNGAKITLLDSPQPTRTKAEYYRFKVLLCLLLLLLTTHSGLLEVVVQVS